MAVNVPNKTIDQQIYELKKKLELYGSDITIHNFKLNEDYRKKLETCKPLTFSIERKLLINKNKLKTEPNPEKMTNFCWGGEGSKRIVAVTNRGNGYVLNTDNGSIILSQNYGSAILNVCAIEQIENNLFAVGGFDGSINLKNIVLSKDNESSIKKFTGHQGGVSAIKFMNTSFLISASFDSFLFLWDINSQGKIVNSYLEHNSEITSLDVNEVNGNIFATGSGDTTVKVWDIREKKACIATFQGSDSSINCVKFLPGRISTLAAGSEDSTVRLYDIRSVKELGIYKKDNGDNSSVNSIGFSKSGCILFASSAENNKISFWNIFGRDLPFCKYEYDSKKENNNGLLKASLNADKTKIGFIDYDEIVIIK